MDFGPRGTRDISSQTGIKPASPTVEVSTTGPTRESHPTLLLFFLLVPLLFFMFLLAVSTFLNNPILFRSKYSGKKNKRKKKERASEKKKERKEDLEEEIQPDTYLVSFFSCEPGVFQSMT